MLSRRRPCFGQPAAAHDRTEPSVPVAVTINQAKRRFGIRPAWRSSFARERERNRHRGGTDMAMGGEMLTSALAGLAFIGCAMTSSGPAGGAATGRAQPGRRREGAGAGKRVKTVDIHAHCIVPEAAAVIGHPLEAPGLLWSNLADRLAEMDAEGIDVEALSVNPYWYRAERDASAELIRIQNGQLAEF